MNQRTRRVSRASVVAASVMLNIGIGLCANDSPAEPHLFLRKYTHLSETQLSAVDRGEAVARILDSNLPTEVIPFGVLRVKMSPDFFVDRYRDIENFKKSKEVLQIGRFHSPPRIEDLQVLTLDSSEIESLKKCRIGDCAVKMPAGMIERFRKEVDWQSPDHAQKAAALYRQALFEYVRTYLIKGNVSLITYNDKRDAARLTDEFRSLLQASPYLSEYLPELHQYLASYPDKRPEAAEDFVYWSKEKFGYKPVVSLTHVTIYRPAGSGRGPVVIAARQLYASHYFLGSLGLSAFAEKTAGDPGGGYLFYLNRTRVDLPQGFFGGVIRYFVKRRVLDGLEKYMKLIRERLEADYRKHQAAMPGTKVH